MGWLYIRRNRDRRATIVTSAMTTHVPLEDVVAGGVGVAGRPLVGVVVVGEVGVADLLVENVGLVEEEYDRGGAEVRAVHDRSA